ncbi:hypothetical protein Y032_0011g1451 [Ancylostoma ceylanicum]|uniref:TLDc domain-containing protein n=1 Tax=Ancylostoma ceylanicum TaxID=53326 RepID=A0A016VGM1_9BILA|nr:hypothetical protein Y032_0011g1451 [Ancylostoma ceylanicum]
MLPKPTTDYSSDILTPIQMWYIQCCLPSKYFATGSSKTDSTSSNSTVKQWTPLYSSATHGISVNRFETNVFDYRGPTVSIFHLTDGNIFVLATEETWRHGSSRFGGAETVLFQLSPKLNRWEASSSIYCNFKIRSAVFGLSFQDVMKIDKDMSNVGAVEVWGCAASNALEDQQKLRVWQNQQAEKNKKILDLLATLIPIIYSKTHRSDENPASDRVKIPAFWSRGWIRFKLCWLPAAAAKLVEHVLTCPINEINGDTRFAHKFAPANWYKLRHEKRVQRPFWDISSKLPESTNRGGSEYMLITQTRI